jgi:hypothetical protein
MARDVNRWIVAVMAICGVIGIAYLPPRRGGDGTPNRARVFGFPEVTPARRRAQGLAGEWRAADGAARLLEQRAGVSAVPARGPTVALTGVEVIPPVALTLVRVALDSAWATLGLEDTKIHVHLVIELARDTPARATVLPATQAQVYLEPDSTNRTTCVALVPAGPYFTRLILGRAAPRQAFVRPGAFVAWLKASLGPCAFYAAYGAPSRPVRSWLAARNWDVGLFLDPGAKTAEAPFAASLLGDARSRWYWERLYSYPPATVACMAGRAEGCRAAVLEGATARQAESLPRVVGIERRWWQVQKLVPAERYLSDVARAVGRERFLSFWGSPLPVDTALATALKMPVGEWTAQWQRGYVAPLRLGAAAPLGASTLALLLGAGAVMAVALAASRRQVR